VLPDKKEQIQINASKKAANKYISINLLLLRGWVWRTCS
jgi:hypothetical protein